MSEGTSLEDIESGTVQFEADQAAMHAIMADMNATEPEMPSMPQMQPQMPPPMMPPPMMPPMMPQMQQYREERFTAQYEPVQEKHEKLHETIQIPTKNVWSQVFDQSRDALIVGVLVCFFSLPALHTLIGKRLPWAYKVGGSMSWIGFLLLFIVSSAAYMGYQAIVKKIGL